MRVGVIILNYNGLNLLKTYLPSVIEHSSNHDIYLADNASTDDSVAWVESNLKEVRLISLDQNYGYAGGYNKAIKQVNNEILCLINSDVRVTSGWCEKIIERFKGEEDLAALQPKIKDDKKSDYFEYAGAAGGFLDRFAYPYCRGRIFDTIEKDVGQYDNNVYLDWASGACFFIRRSAFVISQGFDTEYFAHQEEIDLCWRLRSLGHVISTCNEVEVFHLGGGTLSTNNPKKVYLNFRNNLFNIVKNDLSSTWILILFIRMVLDGVAALKFLRQGKIDFFKAVLKAHFNFYKNFSSNYRKRLLFKKEIKVYNSKKNINSIVFQYFLRNKKYYSQLN